MQVSPTFTEVPEHWKHPSTGPIGKAPEEYGGRVVVGQSIHDVRSRGSWRRPTPARSERDVAVRASSTIFGSPSPSLVISWGREIPACCIGWPEPGGSRICASSSRGPDCRSGRTRPSYDAAAKRCFGSWGLGAPHFYEGRYGSMVAFSRF